MLSSVSRRLLSTPATTSFFPLRLHEQRILSSVVGARMGSRSPTIARATSATNSLSTSSSSSTSAVTGTGTGESSAAAVADHMGTYDKSFEESAQKGDPSKREFTYLVLGGARFMYASAVRLALMKFVASMSASADVLALASLEVDIAKIPVGETSTVKWRGKPVFIRHRTDKEIANEKATPLSALRDPEADEARAQKPEWLVALGICTHLGCVPISNAGDYKGWFCPCHGSHYDASGRIRKGPAPLNLEVPPYKFIENDEKLLIG